MGFSAQKWMNMHSLWTHMQKLLNMIPLKVTQTFKQQQYNSYIIYRLSPNYKCHIPYTAVSITNTVHRAEK